MGTASALARKAICVSALTLTGGLAHFFATQPAEAANYTPRSWLLSTGFSYDLINPTALNNNVSGYAPLQGLFGGRLRIERGLREPDLTHWVDFAYFTGASSETITKRITVATEFKQKLSHMAIVPLGASYWFSRTAHIDFHISAGLGFLIGANYSWNATPVSGAATSGSASGSFAPYVVANTGGRFWLSRYFALDLSAGARYTSSVNATLFGLNMVGGITYAFGGVRGTGRNYVEVIPYQPEKEKPAPRSQQQPLPPQRKTR